MTKKTVLKESLERRIAGYALAAAGVGLVTTAPAAKADIIYTPANIGVSSSGTLFPRISLNNLAPDLAFTGGQVDSGSVGGGFLGVNVTSQGLGLLVGPLQKGAPIGPSQAFTGGGLLGRAYYFSGRHSHFSSGPWLNKQGFLGVKFLIGSQTHFGWVQFAESGGNADESGLIEGYAYDAVANQTILAGQTSTPEPDTLSLLALGALGLGCWRKRRGRNTVEANSDHVG